MTSTMITDHVSFSGTRRTSDGYLVGVAKVARTGVQDYLGSELGRPDLALVRVYRPESEVFNDSTLRSFAHRPITVEHPTEMVDAKNWKKLAAGQIGDQIGDQIVRDGEFVSVPLVLMDADAIAAWEAGKRELSMGYTAEIVFGDGMTPDGQPFNATVRNIAANHLAIVDKARGGSQLRLDSAPPAQLPVFDSQGFRQRMLEQFKDAKHLSPTEVESIVNQLTANAASGHRQMADQAAQKSKNQAFADQYRHSQQVRDDAYTNMCAAIQAGPDKR